MNIINFSLRAIIIMKTVISLTLKSMAYYKQRMGNLLK